MSGLEKKVMQELMIEESQEAHSPRIRIRVPKITVKEVEKAARNAGKALGGIHKFFAGK